MKSTVFLSLALLLVVIRQHVFSAEHDFARWEKSIAAFEQQDKTDTPPKGAILFVGASSIVRWKTLAQDFPSQKILNRGFGGNEICDSTHFADKIIFPYEPKMIFLRAGGNDINGGKTPGQVFADFKEFVATVRAKLPDIDIAYIGMAPSIARWTNRDKEKAVNSMIEEFTKQNPHLKFIDTWTMTLGPDGESRPELFVADKLHYSAEGYKLLAERVRPFLPTK